MTILFHTHYLKPNWKSIKPCPQGKDKKVAKRNDYETLYCHHALIGYLNDRGCSRQSMFCEKI
ncbi:hypothetical protein LZT04_20940, partial [Vibrio fluvialis]|nr:hypothetical protein [Vibrio fluvialis]